MPTSINIGAYSDGNSSKHPAPEDGYSRSSDITYREKTATKWMQLRDEAQPGHTYILDKLPDGYRVFEKLRGNTTHSDKYLFGHPGGKGFNSPAQFFEHFLFLMADGRGTCTCRLCQVTARRTANQSRGARVAPAPLSSVHGTLFERLQKAGRLDEDVTEENRVWQANRKNLADELKACAQQPSFVPRKGELVLYASNAPQTGMLALQEEAGRGLVFQFCDRETKTYIHSPKWKVGIVLSVPSLTFQPADFIAVADPDDNDEFKVVPYLGPNLNSSDTLAMAQSRVIRLAFIRPFCFLEQITIGRTPSEWDETVWHAMDVQASFALVAKQHLAGEWPNAVVSCGAAWVGSELIALGDAIRVADPDAGDGAPLKAMILLKIEVRLENLGHAGSAGVQEANQLRTSIWFTGTAFTDVPNDSFDCLSEALPRDHFEGASSGHGLRGYYPWYPAHGKDRLLRVNLCNVLGRCYEATAVEQMISRDAHFSIGAAVFKWARERRAKNDRRKDQQHAWYWAEHRLDQLNISSGSRLFGMDEPALASDRDLWRHIIKTAQPSLERSLIWDRNVMHEVASNEVASNKVASNEVAPNEVASNKVASNEVGDIGLDAQPIDPTLR